MVRERFRSFSYYKLFITLVKKERGRCWGANSMWRKWWLESLEGTVSGSRLIETGNCTPECTINKLSKEGN